MIIDWLMDRAVATTYLVYLHIITHSGQIEEQVFPVQSRILLHLESKGEQTIYLGEGDRLDLPIAVVYSGEDLASSVQIKAMCESTLITANPMEEQIAIYPHRGSETSIRLLVGVHKSVF